MKVWRVRMRYSPNGTDVTSRAWLRGEVGIWYGAWSVTDFSDAQVKGGRLEDYLNEVPVHKRLGARGKLGKREIDTINRFWGAAHTSDSMSENDWVVVCSGDDEEKAISLGRLKGRPQDQDEHELQMPHPSAGVSERWKFRTVVDKALRSQTCLDFYRLIPQYGRRAFEIFNTRSKQNQEGGCVDILASCGTGNYCRTRPAGCVDSADDRCSHRNTESSLFGITCNSTSHSAPMVWL